MRSAVAAGAMHVGSGEPWLSAAFGGGGPFGIAYALGVADALAHAGVPLADADLLGTSAGAWVAGCLATGVDYARLCDVPQIRVPDPKPGLLRGIAGEVFGDAVSPRVTGCAVRLPRARRVFLSGANHGLADIAAASSAVPALFPPVRLGRTWYVDGGVRSLMSADRARPARHLLVVAPIAGPMFGPAGRAMELMLREELRRWQRDTGGKAHLVRPNGQIAALARHPLHLFDRARARVAYPLAYAQAQRLLAERPGLAGLAIPEAPPSEKLAKAG